MTGDSIACPQGCGARAGDAARQSPMIQQPVARFPQGRALLASFAAMVAALVFLAWQAAVFPQINDDAHITFRVARHLADGRGLVFNPAERRQVSSTPLYCLLLAGTRRAVGAEVPQAARFWEFVFLAACLFLLWWMVVRLGYGHWAWLVPLLAATEPVAVFLSRGMESAMFMMFVLAALIALERRRAVWASALLAGAVLTRLDGLIACTLAGAISAHQMWLQRKTTLQEWWKTRLLPAAVFAALVLPWFAFATVYFGNPFPVTIRHKMAQTQTLGLTPFVIGFLRDFVWDPRLGVPYLRIIPFLIGTAALAVKEKRRFFLVEWSALYLGVYTVAKMPFYLWYQLPLYVPAVALIVAGVAEIERWVRERSKGDSFAKRTLPIALMLIILAQAAVPWPSLIWTAMQPDDSPHRDVKHYKAIGRFLAGYAQPDAVVASLEVGLIAYYSNCRILDLTGLTTQLSEAERRMNPLELVLSRQADFVVMEKWIYDRQPSDVRARFEKEYGPVARAPVLDFSHEVLLLERRDSARRSQPPRAS